MIEPPMSKNFLPLADLAFIAHESVALQVCPLVPEEDDYFVLKPKHSAFFQTNVEILLKYLGATELILTGMAGDICVLFSANDAYMRDFGVFVPADCVASEEPERNRQVLALMERVLGADTTRSTELQFENTKIISPISSTAGPADATIR
jgi:isochorismate hydrolase